MRTSFPRSPNAAAGLVLAVVLVGCAGCGAATPTTAGPTTAGPGTATATAPATASAPGSATRPRPGGAPACAVPTEPIPDRTAGRFTVRQVAGAYRFAADLLARTTFTEAPLDDPQPPQAAFAAAEDGLTPRARTSFRVLTRKLASTTEKISPQENADLIGLASYGVTVAYPGLALRSPAHRDVTCGRASADVLERPGLPDALVLRFPVSGTFLLSDRAGRPKALGWRKEMGLSLVPTDDPARPWLLDGWRADLSLDGPKPDTAS